MVGLFFASSLAFLHVVGGRGFVAQYSKSRVRTLLAGSLPGFVCSPVSPRPRFDFPLVAENQRQLICLSIFFEEIISRFCFSACRRHRRCRSVSCDPAISILEAWWSSVAWFGSLRQGAGSVPGTSSLLDFHEGYMNNKSYEVPRIHPTCKVGAPFYLVDLLSFRLCSPSLPCFNSVTGESLKVFGRN